MNIYNILKYLFTAAAQKIRKNKSAEKKFQQEVKSFILKKEIKKDQLFSPVESFLRSVVLQGHAGLDPTSDTARTLPHRI